MKKQMIIIFTLILSLAFILPVDTAMAAPLNWVELDDFDSYNCDDTYGVNGELSWEVVSGDGDITGDCDVGGDKYLKVVGVGANLAYFNTTSYHTGYYVKMGGGSRSSVVYWYNDTGEPMIKFVRDGGVFRYYSSTGVESMSYSGTAKYLSWQWYTENVIQYKLYDEDFDVLCTYNDTCLISGLESYDDETYKSNTMKMTPNFISHGTFFRFYEYGYIDEDLESPTDLPEVDGVIVSMGESVGVRDCPVNTFMPFGIITVGDSGRRGGFSLTDPYGDIVAFDDFFMTATTFYARLDKIGLYTLKVWDFYRPLTNYWNSSFTVYADDVYEFYNESYPDNENFFEWYKSGVQCEYGVGDKAFAIYRFNDSFLDTLTSPTHISNYRVQIWHNGLNVYDEGILPSDNISILQLNYAFPEDGLYTLRLYNLSWSDLEIIPDTLLYHSSELSVCELSVDVDPDMDGIPGESGDDEDFDDDEDFYDDDDAGIKLMMGLSLSLCIGGFAAFVGAGGLGFIGGFFGAFLLCSQPSVGVLYLIPQGLGVMMVVIGVIIGFIMFMVTR